MSKKEQFIHIDDEGTKRYFSDRHMTILHREDGPAVEYATGSKIWYINDKIHREDGPATVCADGEKGWYINGKELTEEEFNARMKENKMNKEEVVELIEECNRRLRELNEMHLDEEGKELVGTFFNEVVELLRW